MIAETNPSGTTLTVVPPSFFTFEDITLKFNPSDTPEDTLLRGIARMIKEKITCAIIWTRTPKIGSTKVLNAQQGSAGKTKANSPNGMIVVWSAGIEKNGYQIKPEHVLKTVEKRNDFLIVRLSSPEAYNRLS